MRRFAVEGPLDRPDLALDATAAHHLTKVLRHPAGTPFVVFDGSGHEAEAMLVDGVLRLTGPIRIARPARDVHLVVGMPKGPAMDDAVRMSTEAGVTHIHPVRARRTVATGDRHDRWVRIASSAAQQCGRADVPEIYPVGTLAECLQRLQGVTLRIALPGAEPLPSPDGPTAVLVGPEGGWTDTEVEMALKAGAHPMRLGAWVLRTPTACAIAVAEVAPT